jgi:hypothetical protein
LDAAPSRRGRGDEDDFARDRERGPRESWAAIVEAVGLDTVRPDFFSPWCAIPTFRDGKIIQDHTDLEPNRRPGIEADVPYFVSPRNLDSRRQADA